MQFQACAYCDHPNPVGTNYCNDCGAALHLKPCRHCGAVAVAQARHCPACQAAFPARPMIDVDIPWAVPGDQPPEPGPTPPEPAATPAGKDREEADLDAASPAIVATRRLIEKASERASTRLGAKALVLPPRDDRDHGEDDGSLPRNPDRGPAAARFGPVDAVVPDTTRSARALLAPRPAHLPPRRSQTLPVVVLSLLGLVIAVALLFLIDYAGTRDTVREIASPRKILHPEVAVPAPATVATPAPAQASAPSAAAPAVEASPTAPPTAAPRAAPTPAAGSLPASAPDASEDPTATSGSAAAAATVPQPETAAASDSSTNPPATMSTTDSQPVAGAPARDDAAPSAPADPAACRAELQALGLCDKVAR